MRILVTGSSGFVGGHLFRRMVAQGGPNKIVGVSRTAGRYPWQLENDGGPETVNCDLRLEAQVASLMLRFKPEVVFHLGADPLVKNWGPAVSHSNYMATHHLLTHAPEGCRFVFASSATVYGNGARWGAVETDPMVPTSPYGAAKAGSEHLVHAFTTAGKLSGLSLRLAATVGAGATHGLVPDLIRKVLSDAPALELIGDRPGSFKPFTHVDDVVAGLVYFGLRPDLKGSLNLALDDNLSVGQVADIVKSELVVQKPSTWTGLAGIWPGDNPSVRVSNRLARQLGWEPKYESSAEAVRRAVRDITELSRGAACTSRASW